MKQNFAVEGLVCEGCTDLIADTLKELPGVMDVRVDQEAGCAEVDYAPELVTPTGIIEAIQKAGKFRARRAPTGQGG